MPKFTVPKGMKDIEPEEMAQREAMYAKMKEILALYSFRLVEPSQLENLETLVAKSGPAIEKEIYAFRDKGGRKIGLRFDLTVGMARMIANSQLPKPIRLACISNMWRYDNPQYARYRSFWQWDAEIYGSAGVEADAEIIALTNDILRAFNLDFVIKISNRKLVEGFLLSIGVKKKDLVNAMRLLDKRTKLSANEFKNELKKFGVDAKKIEEFARADINKIKELATNNLAKSGFNELKELFALLDTYKINYEFDPSIVRGIDYYTGIVYEAWIKGETKLGAVAGGGRYDDLLALYGNPMPACGIAGGIERLMLSLKEKIKSSDKTVFVAFVNDVKFAVEIAEKLRKLGISAVYDVSKRDLRRQMEYANKIGATVTVIIGPKEAAEGKVKVREMQTGKESELDTSELMKIKSLLEKNE